MDRPDLRWLPALLVAALLGTGVSLAETEKVVLAEDFTATWCGDCPYARCALEILLDEFGDQLIVAEHHLTDILDTPWTNDRTDLYGVGPIPHVQFDGKYEVVGASSCPQAAEAYRAVINQRLAETGGISPVEIAGSWWHDDESVHLQATFRLTDPGTLLDTEAHLLALEDDIYWQGATYNHVTRGAHSEAVTLDAVGDSVTVSAEFTISPTWELSEFEGIAFLQRMSGDYEVYQSARLEQTVDIALGFDEPRASVPQGHGLARFHGTVTNEGDSADEMTLSLQSTFGWHAEFRIAGETDFGTDPVVRTLTPGEQLPVDLQVFTDDLIGIGSGHLVSTSANTGAARRTRATVYNGSPAILVVDDDYVNEDQQVITEALDAGGYLYGLWSVYVDHLNIGPAFADMTGYDVVVWHHGWVGSDLLSPTDVASLTAYMDGGGRLILSSQDYLSTTGSNDFTQNYLGIAGWTEDVGAEQSIGVDSDPISDGMGFDLDYPGGDANRADDVSPNGIGTVIFRSEMDDRVALRADNGTGRAVFFAFGLNAMSEIEPAPNNPATLIDRAIGWLLSTAGTDVVEDPVLGTASRIVAIAPNPLVVDGAGVGTASIQLALTARGAGGVARLDVLDPSGRLVRTVLHRRLPAGGRRLAWDGRDARGRLLDSGIYHLRLQTIEGVSASDLILIR